MEPILKWSTETGFSVAGAIIITLILYYIGLLFVGRIVRKVVASSRRHREWHPKDIEKRQNTLAALFTNLWRVLIITGGIFAVFRKIFPDTDLAPLFASAGIIGVALGFGAQSLVKDFISGIFIISENQYRVGDIVDIEGASGTVERIGTRSTVLRDADGNVHYFPNGMVQHVINKTMGYSMTRFSIGVHPSSDLDKVIAIINDTGTALAKEDSWEKKIITPPAFISVGDFTSNGVDLLVAGKTQPSDQWSVTAEMRRRLLVELENNNIELSATLPVLSTTKKK